VLKNISHEGRMDHKSCSAKMRLPETGGPKGVFGNPWHPVRAQEFPPDPK